VTLAAVSAVAFPAQAGGLQVERVAPDWMITCAGGDPDETGEIQTPAHCRIEKTNITALVVIDRHGAHVPVNDPVSPCDGRPGRVAVDKRQITALSTRMQIAAMKAGTMFARSDLRAWPDCSERIETTQLAGFGDAYAAAKAAWVRYSSSIR